MKPSPILCKRLKTRVPFTTKEVGKGFYRGTGTGSMGAHTPRGGYLIDYRKVRHFVMPDLGKNELTPFVTAELYKGYRAQVDDDEKPYKLYYNGFQYLKWYKQKDAENYQFDLEYAAKQAGISIDQTSGSLFQEEPLLMEPEDKNLQQGRESAGSSSQQK